MVRCSVCGVDEMLPFRCTYCGLPYCSSHRLPENHGCIGISKTRSPEEIRLRAAAKYVSRGAKPQLSFTKSETAQLAIAAAVVSVAGLSLVGFAAASITSLAFLVGGFCASFIGHELAHKFTAIRRGLSAEFKIFPPGLFVTLITSLLPVPFKVIMPGAVVIRGLTLPRTIGEIAAAGPLFNFIAATALFVLAKVLNNFLLEIVASINAFLMFFNMLPIPPLDGEKVLNWSWKVWLTIFVMSLALLTVIQLF
ncbi:MAG: AN1-type zinc finger domain-containing protein [Candidatus Caldarchaeum sp.]